MHSGRHLLKTLILFTVFVAACPLFAHATVQYLVAFQTDGTAGASLAGSASQWVSPGGGCTAVTANAPSGYVFVKWTNGGVDFSADNPLTVTNVMSDMTLTAVYAPQYTVDFQTDGTVGASLTGTLSQKVLSGGDCTEVSASAPEDHVFIKWTKAGADFSTSSAITVTNVTESMTLTAVFARVIDDLAELQSIGVDAGRPLSGSYCLVSDLSAHGNSVTPIGSTAAPFTGKFFGQGHSLILLTIMDWDTGNSALFRSVGAGAEIRNLTVQDINVIAWGQYVAGLAALNYGLIDDCHVSGSVSYDAYTDFRGGLVGENESSGSISRCSSSAQVVGRGGCQGGLVGINYGSIADSFAAGVVHGGMNVGGFVGYSIDGSMTDCHATGNVDNNNNNGSVGGLLGYCYGTALTRCFATGNVNCYGPNGGGLAGVADAVTMADCFATGRVTCSGSKVSALVGGGTPDAVTECYAVGSVSGSVSAGLLGYDGGSVPTFSKCYWNTETTGQTMAVTGLASVAGTFGESTANMLKAATYAGWGIGSGGVFGIVEGKTYPYLTGQPPTATITETVPPEAGKVKFRVAFSMPVPGFAFEDLSLTYTGLTHVSHTVTPVDAGNPRFWDVAITVDGTEGSVAASVNCGGVITSSVTTVSQLATPSNPGAKDITTSTITWTWKDNSSMEDGYKTYAGEGTAALDTIYATTFPDVQEWTMNGLLPNAQYAFQVAAWKGATLSAKTANFSAWTLANRPKPMLLSNAGASTMDAVIDTTDGNPAGTLYAIQCATTGQYVQAGGGLGTYSVWKTAADWGAVTVSGLSEHTSYGFSAVARNGAGVNTWIGIAAHLTTLDATAPTGAIAINGGASFTFVPEVTLSLSADDGTGSGVTAMRFSDDGAVWSGWMPFSATHSHTLPGTEGYKTVRVQFRDAAGNVSLRYSDYILLDSTAPTGSVSINGGAWGTGSANVTLSLSAMDTGGPGVTGMRFSDDGAHWTPWETFSPVVPHTLQGADGNKTVRVQYRDYVGHVSDVYSDYILLDTTAPSGAVMINGGAFATNNADATLNLTWDDGASGSGARQMRFSDDGAHWTPWKPVALTAPHTLPGADGQKTVRVQYRDALGNVSANVTDYILLDTAKPTGTISINGGASSTASANVTLSLTWSDGTGGSGVRLMRFSDDGMHWSAWETAAAAKAHMLSPMPLLTGYKTVRVQYRDAAGNYSDAFSDYILLTSK